MNIENKTETKEKKYYILTIKDDKGEVVTEIKTDCILAAINNPSMGTKDKAVINAISMSSSTNGVVLNALKALDAIKMELFEKDPLLSLVYLMKKGMSKSNKTTDSSAVEFDTDSKIAILEE